MHVIAWCARVERDTSSTCAMAQLVCITSDALVGAVGVPA